MISIASQLFSLVSISKPDSEMIENVFVPYYKQHVVGSTMFDSDRPYRLHWFRDGSMLFRFNKGNPIVVDEFVQLTNAVKQYCNQIDMKQFSVDLYNMILSYIEVNNYPGHNAEMVIIDSCTWETSEES